jgi:hypothetical protein
MAEVSERQQLYHLGELSGEWDYAHGAPPREDVHGAFGRGYRDGYAAVQERDTDGHAHWQSGEDADESI